MLKRSPGLASTGLEGASGSATGFRIVGSTTSDTGSAGVDMVLRIQRVPDAMVCPGTAWTSVTEMWEGMPVGG